MRIESAVIAASAEDQRAIAGDADGAVYTKQRNQHPSDV
jgi:hypothetical protein